MLTGPKEEANFIHHVSTLSFLSKTCLSNFVQSSSLHSHSLYSIVSFSILLFYSSHRRILCSESFNVDLCDIDTFRSAETGASSRGPHPFRLGSVFDSAHYHGLLDHMMWNGAQDMVWNWSWGVFVPKFLQSDELDDLGLGVDDSLCPNQVIDGDSAYPLVVCFDWGHPGCGEALSDLIDLAGCKSGFLGLDLKSLQVIRVGATGKSFLACVFRVVGLAFRREKLLLLLLVFFGHFRLENVDGEVPS